MIDPLKAANGYQSVDYEGKTEIREDTAQRGEIENKLVEHQQQALSS